MTGTTGTTAEFADEPIGRVDPSDEGAMHRALSVLLTGRVRHADAAVEQFLRFVRQHQVELDRVWIAGPSRQPGGAVMLASNPGRTSMLFLSPVTRQWRPERMVKLVAAAVASEDRRRTAMVQALLDPHQDAEAAVLLDCGFERLAMLSYLQREGVRRAGEEDAATARLSVTHWSEGARRLFERAILGSYERTLDCPGLLGRRSIDDIIAGHMATGVFDPRLWSVYQSDGEPAAVLLLNELSSHDGGALELVYLGVCAAHRRRGVARSLVKRTIQIAAARRLGQVMLAVDEANTPAMALYRGLGFTATGRKSALVREVV